MHSPGLAADSLPAILERADLGMAEQVYLWGATVCSWTQPSGDEVPGLLCVLHMPHDAYHTTIHARPCMQVLYVRPDAKFDKSKASKQACCSRHP